MSINKVAILIKKAALEFDKISNPFFAQYDLSAAQFKVLKLIYMQKSRTARVVDLEREFSMTHPTALGLLDQLEKKGFTTRIPNPEEAPCPQRQMPCKPSWKRWATQWRRN